MIAPLLWSTARTWAGARSVPGTFGIQIAPDVAAAIATVAPPVPPSVVISAWEALPSAPLKR